MMKIGRITGFVEKSKPGKRGRKISVESFSASQKKSRGRPRKDLNNSGEFTI